MEDSMNVYGDRNGWHNKIQDVLFMNNNHESTENHRMRKIIFM